MSWLHRSSLAFSSFCFQVSSVSSLSLLARHVPLWQFPGSRIWHTQLQTQLEWHSQLTCANLNHTKLFMRWFFCVCSPTNCLPSQTKHSLYFLKLLTLFLMHNLTTFKFLIIPHYYNRLSEHSRKGFWGFFESLGERRRKMWRRKEEILLQIKSGPI